MFSSVLVQAEDICHQPKKVGSCKAAFSRYYFNSAVGECKEFTYGGCQENENNFKTSEACQKKCYICKLPEEPGLCLGYFTRYYYDSKAGECKDFIYGECVGNENNFKTLKACKKKCVFLSFFRRKLKRLARPSAPEEAKRTGIGRKLW